MFTKEDIAKIEERGSSVKNVEAQVERFKKGFPWMEIVGPAKIGRASCRERV